MSIFKVISKGASILASVTDSIGNILTYLPADAVLKENLNDDSADVFNVTGPLLWIKRGDQYEVLNTTNKLVNVTVSSNELAHVDSNSTATGPSVSSRTLTKSIVPIQNTKINEIMDLMNDSSLITVANATLNGEQYSYESIFSNSYLDEASDSVFNYSVSNMPLDNSFKIYLSKDGKTSITGKVLLTRGQVDEKANYSLVCRISGWPHDTAGQVLCEIVTGDGDTYQKVIDVDASSEETKTVDVDLATNVVFTNPNMDLISIRITAKNDEANTLLRGHIEHSIADCFQYLKP